MPFLSFRLSSCREAPLQRRQLKTVSRLGPARPRSQRPDSIPCFPSPLPSSDSGLRLGNRYLVRHLPVARGARKTTGKAALGQECGRGVRRGRGSRGRGREGRGPRCGAVGSPSGLTPEVGEVS